MLLLVLHVTIFGILINLIILCFCPAFIHFHYLVSCVKWAVMLVDSRIDRHVFGVADIGSQFVAVMVVMVVMMVMWASLPYKIL